MRLRTAILLAVLSLAPAHAGTNSVQKYQMNIDLIVKTHDGDIVYSHQLQGINFLSGKPFHGKDLGEIDYFLTITGADDGKGKLTIEFYRYETRKKRSDVLAELVEEVSFDFGSPTTFESRNDEFGVNLAFSIAQK